MPKTLKIGPNPLFKPETAEQKAAWETVKGTRPMIVPYVTAMDNIRLSGNMYAILFDDEPETLTPGPRLLEDYSMEELKVMLVSLGIKTEKTMKRDDVVRLIRRKLDEVEIVDEGDGA